MPSEHFLVAVRGTLAADRPDLKAKLQETIERAVTALDRDGIYLESMALAYGTPEQIQATLKGAADRG